LLRLGETLLRSLLLQPGPGVDSSRVRESAPLAKIMALQGPLIELMQALQWHSVVEVDPLALVRGSLFFPGVPNELQLETRRDALSFRLELHLLPHYDSVSNMIRATRLPFCYETAYLFTVASMVRAASGRRHIACEERCGLERNGTCEPLRGTNSTGSAGAAGDCTSAGAGRLPHHLGLRLWEVGANLGDCTLWAVAMLSGRVVAGPPAATRLDAVAFEPLPASASALRRSAHALLQQLRKQASDSTQSVTASGAPLLHDNPTFHIEVQELALSERPGTRVLGVPRSSFAESTFQGCEARYDVGVLAPGCDNHEIETDTIDRFLSPGFAGKAPGPPLVDLLKVHAQGDELPILRGARRALAAGQICVVMLKLTSVGMFGDSLGEGGPGLGSHRAVGHEIHGLLAGFRAALVQPNGTSWVRLGSDRRSAHHLAWHVERARRQTMPEGWTARDEKGRGRPHPYDRQLVAWHEGALCRGSVAAAAARAVWGRPTPRAATASI